MIRWLIRHFGLPLVLPVIDVPQNAREWIENTTQRLIEEKQCSFLKLNLKNSQNHVLSGIVISHPTAHFVNKKEEKWLFWCCGNGEQYENCLEFAIDYAFHLGTHLMAFNYRGIGSSEGVPFKANDLVDDAEVFFNYLLNQGVSSNNILIHGRSLGGGIGAQLRARFPDGPFISERSFYQLSEMAAFMVGPIMKKITQMIDWEMDSLSAWKKIQGTKIAIFHKKDRIVPYEHYSLAYHLAQNNDNSILIELTSQWIKKPQLDNSLKLIQDTTFWDLNNPIASFHREEPHNQSLDLDPSEWIQILNAAKKALQLNSD